MPAATNEKPEPRLPPGLALAWGVAPPARRGPKPAFNVEDLVAAAMTLADEGGIEAVSMAKIGQRLGFTANALYRYVQSRDELLVLLLDAAWQQAPAQVSTHPHWRDAAQEWTEAVLAVYADRPWLLDVPIRGAPVTPNMLRWLETFLAGMSSSGLADSDMLGCALLLDGYARSAARLARDMGYNSGPPATATAVADFLLPLLHERGYPIMAELMTAGPYESDLSEEDVDFGLRRTLDGIEVFVEEQKAARGE